MKICEMLSMLDASYLLDVVDCSILFDTKNCIYVFLYVSLQHKSSHK